MGRVTSPTRSCRPVTDGGPHCKVQSWGGRQPGALMVLFLLPVPIQTKEFSWS